MAKGGWRLRGAWMVRSEFGPCPFRESSRPSGWDCLQGGSVPAPVQVVTPCAAVSIKHLSGALVGKSPGLKAVPGWAAASCGCRGSAPCQADGAEVGAPGWSRAGGWQGTAGPGGADVGCAVAAGMRAAPSAAASAMPLTTSARRSSMPAPHSTPCPPPPRPRAGTRP